MSDAGVGGGRLALGVAALLAAVVAAVAVPGGDPWAATLTLVGLAALLAGGRSALRRYREGPTAAATGDVELRVPVPTPGEGFTRALGTFEDEGAAYLAYPDRVRAALTNAAVAVLGRYRGIPTGEARRRLREGTWTDDRLAAAFLAGEVPPGDGVLDRLRRGVGAGESPFRRGIRHAVAAVADVAGADVGGAGAAAGGSDDARGVAGGGRTDGAGADGGTAGSEVRTTGRWTGIAAGTLSCVGLGLVGNWPAVTLAGTVGLGVAAYSRVVRPPGASVAVERSVDRTRAAPGERVSVTLTVRNEGDRAVPDLRVVDGVPPALSVVSGSARTATALPAGGATTLEYDLRAARGVHGFDPVQVLARDAAGTVERERRVRAGDPEGNADGAAGTTVTCVPPLVAGVRVPIAGATAGYAGEVSTGDAGEGIEFHSVRAYRPSDPIGRVDWKRYARTRRLAAREFDAERAATVVVVVDARAEAYLSPGPGHDHAVDRAVAAAGEALAGLAAGGNRVGIAALGRSECWLSPGTGSAHRARARDLLATHAALSPVPPGGDGRDDREWTAWLRSRLPADARVAFVSPVCDDVAAGVVRRLRAHGYPVTAVSPDPTAARTPSQALARVGRRLRLARLRDAGAVVVDWRADEPLAAAVGRATRR